MQLVATGTTNNDMFGDLFTRAQTFDEVAVKFSPGFNLSYSFAVGRIGDVLQDLFFEVTMGPAPAGFRWKRNYWLNLFDNVVLTYGCQTLVRRTSAMMEMERLIHGRRASAAATFDYDDALRSQLSRGNHTICVCPLHLSDLITDEFKIPLTGGGYDELKVSWTIGRLEDCLEPVGSAHLFPADANPMLRMLPILHHIYLDTEERQRLMEANSLRIIKQHYLISKTVGTADGVTDLPLWVYGICSAGYVWITDEHGSELPHQVLDRLTVTLNSFERMDQSGFSSRMITQTCMPHATCENNESHNLYYIPYYGGETNRHGAERGINFSRIHDFRYGFKWNVGVAPSMVRIHIMHRSQNILQASGLRYDDIDPGFEEPRIEE